MTSLKFAQVRMVLHKDGQVFSTETKMHDELFNSCKIETRDLLRRMLHQQVEEVLRQLPE